MLRMDQAAKLARETKAKEVSGESILAFCFPLADVLSAYSCLFRLLLSFGNMHPYLHATSSHALI